MASWFSSEWQSYDPAWDVSSCSELETSSQQESPIALSHLPCSSVTVLYMSTFCHLYSKPSPTNAKIENAKL